MVISIALYAIVGIVLAVVKLAVAERAYICSSNEDFFVSVRRAEYNRLSHWVGVCAWLLFPVLQLQTQGNKPVAPIGIWHAVQMVCKSDWRLYVWYALISVVAWPLPLIGGYTMLAVGLVRMASELLAALIIAIPTFLWLALFGGQHREE